MSAAVKLTKSAGERRAMAPAFDEGGAKPTRLEPFERLAQSFARLSVAQQDAFLDLNAEAIERWNANRVAPGRKGLRSVAR